jgi:hypothetical protein
MDAFIAALKQEEIAELEQQKLAARAVLDDLNLPNRNPSQDRPDDEGPDGPNSQAPTSNEGSAGSVVSTSGPRLGSFSGLETWRGEDPSTMVSKQMKGLSLLIHGNLGGKIRTMSV